LEKSYIHADGQILSQVSHGAQGTDVYYYVHDRLGSVRMVVGYDGQTASVANGYAYRPFGAFYEGECVETVDSPFCFTGQWRDAEIDQYYLRARQYDPAMMRFMTRDRATRWPSYECGLVRRPSKVESSGSGLSGKRTGRPSRWER
jgi:RHS repeat-associated protein